MPLHQSASISTLCLNLTHQLRGYLESPEPLFQCIFKNGDQVIPLFPPIRSNQPALNHTAHWGCLLRQDHVHSGTHTFHSSSSAQPLAEHCCLFLLLLLLLLLIWLCWNRSSHTYPPQGYSRLILESQGAKGVCVVLYGTEEA